MTSSFLLKVQVSFSNRLQFTPSTAGLSKATRDLWKLLKSSHFLPTVTWRHFSSWKKKKSKSSQKKLMESSQRSAASAHARRSVFPQNNTKSSVKNIKEKPASSWPGGLLLHLCYAARPRSPTVAHGRPLPSGAVCRGFSQSQLDLLRGEVGAAQERGLLGSETWEPSGFLSSERWETRAAGRVQNYLRVKY